MPYVDKKIREIHFNKTITKYKATQGLHIKLQQLKCRTNLKFYQNNSNYYYEMKYQRQNGTYQFDENPFVQNVEGIGKITHEVSLLMKFS